MPELVRASARGSTPKWPQRCPRRLVHHLPRPRGVFRKRRTPKLRLRSRF